MKTPKVIFKTKALFVQQSYKLQYSMLLFRTQIKISVDQIVKEEETLVLCSPAGFCRKYKHSVIKNTSFLCACACAEEGTISGKCCLYCKHLFFLSFCNRQSCKRHTNALSFPFIMFSFAFDSMVVCGKHSCM